MTRSNTIKHAAWITAVLAVGALVLPTEAASRQPVTKKQAQVSAQVDQQSFGRNPKARAEKQRDNQRARSNRNPQRDNSRARAEQQRNQQEARQRQESERRAQAQREAQRQRAQRESQQRQRAEREAQQRKSAEREDQQRKAAQREAQQRRAAEREDQQRKAAQREAQQQRETRQRNQAEREAQQRRQAPSRAAQQKTAKRDDAPQRAPRQQVAQKPAAKQPVAVRGENWGVNAQKKKLAERQAVVRRQEQRLEQKRIEQRQDLRQAKQRFENKVQNTKQVLRNRDARLDAKARALRIQDFHNRGKHRAPYVNYRAHTPKKVYYKPRPHYGYRTSRCVYKRDYDWCDWGDYFSVRVIFGTDCGFHYEHGHRRYDCCSGGYYIWKWCEPVLETRYDYYGEPYTVVIADGYWKRVWTPHYCRYGIHFYYAD